MNPNDPEFQQATPDVPNPISERPHAGTVFGRDYANRPKLNELLVQDPSRIGTDYPDPRTLGANVSAPGTESERSMPIRAVSPAAPPLSDPAAPPLSDPAAPPLSDPSTDI